MAEKKLPVGIEYFSEIITDGYYYVDKTGLIKDLLEQRAGKHDGTVQKSAASDSRKAIRSKTPLRRHGDDSRLRHRLP